MSNGENFGGIVTTIQQINSTYMTPKAYRHNFAGIIKALDDLSSNISSSGDTNLSYDSSTRVISSSTGTNATLSLAVAAGDDGLLTGADKTQLNNLSSNLSGKANLIAGKLVSSELPDIAISEFKGTVANQTAMLAITGQEGDWVIRSDEGKVYLITGSDPTQIGSWTSLSYPASDVQSVNGFTGVVILNADTISDTSTTNKFTTASEKTKLAGIEAGAQANVISNWDSSSGDSQILNKPLLYNNSSVDTHLNTGSASSNEVLSWTGSDYDWVTQSGGGAVDSVNSQTGTVLLDADDISDSSTTNKFTTSAEATKLAGIEAGAEVNVATNLSYTASNRTVASSTGTNAVISEVVASGDSGLITGADKAKLNGIESGATTDQTAAEIKTAYESNADTNEFSDAEQSKLDGIESGATQDQTAAEILTAVKTVDGNGSGLDADLLDGQEGSYYLDYGNFSNTPTIPTNNNQLTNGAGFITSTLTNEQVQDITGGMVTGNTETGITVTYQDSDGTLDFAVASQTDNNFTTTLKNKLDSIESGATADQTAGEIKTAYLSNSDTNNFDDATQTKLSGIAAGAEVNVNADWNSSSGDSQILNKPTIPAAYTDSSVDSHLNTLSASSNEVLSWTGSDYDWVAQSSGGAVDSVNTQTGAVVLDTDDISDSSATNKYTTAADISKLAGIESDATADQSATEIKTAYESNSDTNAFTDAEQTKLSGVAAGAEVNVQSDWNSSSGDSQILNKPTIPAAYTNSDVDTHLNTSSASSNEVLSWTGSDYDWVAQSGGGGGTPSRYLHVDGSGSQALTTSLATVDFDTTIVTSDASDFTVGSGGEITVVNAGTYYIEYSLDGDQSSGNNRVIVTGEVQVGGTAVTGSECSVYSRNTADGDFTAVGSCIAVLTANNVVRVQAQKDSGTITTSLELGTSALSIFSLAGSGPQGPTGAAGADGPSDIPQNAQTSAYTLVAGDNGKHINITTGGVTIPSGVFSAGNVVSIFNDSGSDQTITQGGSVTLRLAGSATTGNRTLAQYGLCSALCVASNEFVISGAGLS